MRLRTPPHAPQQGFTLIELSVVLVIVSLIVGGIIAARTMIEAAELQSVVADFHNIEVAYKSFELKYNAMPGDFLRADEYWPGNLCDGNSCNGDGNAIIEDEEAFTLWKMLNEAGFYINSLIGYDRSIDTLGMVLYGEGANSPLSKWQHVNGGQGAGYVFRYKTGCGSWEEYPREDYTMLGIVSPSVTIDTCHAGGVFTPGQARSLDLKMDDGDALRGRLLVNSPFFPTLKCVEATISHNYNVANEELSCDMGYVVK